MIFAMDLIDDVDDNEKFENIYREYGSAIYRELVMILKDYNLADDAMQQVLYRIAKNINIIETDEKGRLFHYLKTIAKNVAYTMCSKCQKENVIDIDSIDVMDEKEFEKTVLEKVTYEKLLNALRKLEDKDRNILMLYYFDEWDLKEIASVTEVSYEAAKKRLQRAVKKLAGFVKKEDFYE